MRPAIIAALGNKGGVGKTASITSIAAALAAAGARVLVVDLDQQRNSTLLMGPIVPEGETPYTILDVTASPDAAATIHACYPTEWNELTQISGLNGYIDVIPGDDQFSEIHVSKYGLSKLRESLESLGDRYQVILIDCPPSTGLAVQAAINAAEQVFLVSQPEHLSTIGLNQMSVLINEFNDHYPGNTVHVAGVLVTQYIAQQVEHRAALAEIRDSYGTLLWLPPVPNRAVVQRASAAHYPLLAYPDLNAQQLSAIYAAAAIRLLLPANRPELDYVLTALSVQAGVANPLEVAQ
jgi:chromosome partitioning protein